MPVGGGDVRTTIFCNANEPGTFRQQSGGRDVCYISFG